MLELLRSHKEALKALTVAGVVSPVWLRDLRIVETYEAISVGSKMDRYEYLALKFELDVDTIRRILRKMRKK